MQYSLVPQTQTVGYFFVSPQVRDQEIPVKRNFVKVVIHVEDCNDHSPVFLSPRYEASISNMAPKGSEVVRVKALDKDMGSNADISYSLHAGEKKGLFLSFIYARFFSASLCFTFIHLHIFPPGSSHHFLMLTAGSCPIQPQPSNVDYWAPLKQRVQGHHDMPQRRKGFSLTFPWFSVWDFNLNLLVSVLLLSLSLPPCLLNTSHIMLNYLELQWKQWNTFCLLSVWTSGLTTTSVPHSTFLYLKNQSIGWDCNVLRVVSLV